jgi:dienelactone hydrolase
MNPPNDQQPATINPQRASRARRLIKRLARIAIFVYLGLCVVFFALQDYLIFPGRSTQGAKHAVVRESSQGNYEIVRLTTSRGDKTVALFGRAQDDNGQPRADANKQPTILFFYGNAMCMADCFGIMQSMRKLGVNVMVAEYIGYGMSSGKSSEQTLYETADACWDHLQSRRDIDPTKIIPSGWSLGAAVAIDLASRKPVAGLVTFSAFTTMSRMARIVVPFLPTSLMLSYRFDNVTKIKQLQVPILFVHGEHDRLIPHQMSDELAAAATRSPRVTRVSIFSDHNDVFETDEAVYGPLKQFIDAVR